MPNTDGLPKTSTHPAVAAGVDTEAEYEAATKKKEDK